MSLSTFADLKTSISVWLAREGDTTLTTYIPDMITLFEAAACRKLKVRPQEAIATITTTVGVGPLPTDYLGYRRVTWTGQPVTDLNYVSPSAFKFDTPYSVAGTPQEFTIQASSIYINPTDDTGLEILYYQKTPAVSSSLNWLWTNHPDAYLAGSLAQASAFGKKFDQAGMWKARMDEIFQEIFGLDFNERQGMAIRVLGQTP